MNYQETLEFLYKQLPAFQQKGKDAVNWKLDNIKKLCEHFGNPQNKFKSIHVAGTNGKGSTSHLLASILQEAGYKTGLYTSPHLKDFRERFRINGELVEKSYVIDFVKSIDSLVYSLKPSFFEITVVLAFKLFAEQQVDIAVIEVGLGGRLDSTNIITPILSLITNIGMDHMDMLGDTIEKIAAEKAGIIKPGIPVVVSEYQKETAPIFIHHSLERKSEVFFAKHYFSVEVSKAGDPTNFIVNDIFNHESYTMSCPLSGLYQKKNLAGVLTAISIVNKGNDLYIQKEAITKGIENVIKNTRLKGRWQTLKTKPLTICDTGHNKEAFLYLIQYVNQNKFNHYHFVLGFAKDKDIGDVLNMLPLNSSLYFTEFQSFRSTKLSVLKSLANTFSTKAAFYENVNQAIKAANETAGSKDFIFVGGSTYVVAEIDNL